MNVSLNHTSTLNDPDPGLNVHSGKIILLYSSSMALSIGILLKGLRGKGDSARPAVEPSISRSPISICHFTN